MKKYIFLMFLPLLLVGCGTDKKLTRVDENFLKPYIYIGQPVQKVAEKLSAKPNSIGNVIIDSKQHHFLFESSDGSVVSYVDVQFLETSPCAQSRSFDSASVLAALGVNVDSLELIRKQAHFHTYYDHENRLKVGVSCLYNGAAINASFSKKYYGQ
ncbi:hypothetical protein [Photobacterium salinisoli]|uniref:hypothetical protein n=1 Tax=Photobacterium salinisoli TaxID=1616783 RepID=UPI000EA14F65|nr:hypothetical protein [Photobacterium salinisoli]